LALACSAGSAATPSATADPGDPAAQRAQLGVAQVRSLESFAAALGRRLGSPDDGPVITAANEAIAAASHSGGLAVALPMGLGLRTSAALVLDNDGGYFCQVPGQCMVTPVRAADSAAASWLVSVRDPYATNLVLSGISFFGGWSYRRGPYAEQPERDPWLDREGGVLIAHAFTGVNDIRFIASNRVKTQLPTDHIENLVIAGFGGDCLKVAGAGQNTYHNIRGANCGGHGLIIDSYDNKFSDIDFGNTGRACLFLDGNGATDTVQGKVWYCGFRLMRNDDQGVRNTASGDMIDMIVQDTYGDGVFNSGRMNLIHAIISWQGELAPMDPGPIAAYVCQGCDHNIVTIAAGIDHKTQAYPNVTRLYRDLSNGARFGQNNIVTIDAWGWPQDNGGPVWQPFWFEGPLDLSNRITLNGVERAHYETPGPSGVLDHAIRMNGSAAGVLVFGPSSASAGKVAVLCQGEAASACVLQGFHNTAASASGVLTATANFAPGETVAVGGQAYVFDDALENRPAHVRIGADLAASLASLAHAINAEGGAPGIDYAAVTTPNAAVSASAAPGALTVTARLAGADGNAVATVARAAHAAWSGPTLAGGAAGEQTYSPAVTWDRDGHPGLPNLRGPYPDDAAAAAAGVAIGELYRDAASVVHVRSS
jgi:hypothetical protein